MEIKTTIQIVSDCNNTRKETYIYDKWVKVEDIKLKLNHIRRRFIDRELNSIGYIESVERFIDELSQSNKGLI